MDHLRRSLGNGLVNAALERAAELRGHEARLRELLDNDGCRIVPLCEDRNLVSEAEPPGAVRLTRARLAPQPADNPIFLGAIADQPCFALDLAPGDPRLAALGQYGRFVELRAVGGWLGAADAALLSYARGMCHWHRRHGFCSACGHPTHAARAGHVRRCSNPGCGRQHFPRTDPAIIVLVHAREHCLLGRKRDWPEGRFSTIAGFVEPGEAVEQAVVREVHEETAIEVAAVSYHSSQPWPFPASVMLGFHARARTRGDIALIDGELEDARWFSRRQVARALDGDGPLKLPPDISIARRLIEDWYHDGLP